MAFERPHIQFPFQRGANGKVNCVEQGEPEHVMSCEMVIVHCPLGYRDDRPDFGWPWPELQNMPLDLSGLEQALERFEPRGDANVTQYADLAASVVSAHVDVLIREG